MKKLWALLPLPLALLIRRWASTNAEAVERLFSRGLYPALAAPFSRLTALCSFPIIEPLLVLVVLFIIVSILRRRLFPALAITGFFLSLFIAGWGLNYDRLPLENTLSLPVQPSALSELEALCRSLVDSANAWYTAPEEGRDLFSGADEALRLAADGGWPIPKGRFGTPKEALISPLLSRWMIEGITSPFTLEALVNGNIPDVSKPFVACHEAAHLRGFAREDDANLIAFLACVSSNDPYYRYSGAFSMLLHCLEALHSADADAYLACSAALSPEVLADIAKHAAFWNEYRDKPAANAVTKINDRYLQAMTNGEQSTRSYGRVVDLLLALARKERNEG